MAKIFDVITGALSRRQVPVVQDGRIRPRIRAKDVIGRRFGKREALIAIRWAAKRRYKVRIKYTRIQDGMTKTYVIEPYSFRYRRTRDGVRKMLFAYHGVHRRIHGFVTRNILSAKVLKETFQPRWKVELE